MKITIRAANRRARERGVDLMEINPRPLRTPRRLEENNPRLTVSRAWGRTFSEIDKASSTISSNPTKYLTQNQ